MSNRGDIARAINEARDQGFIVEDLGTKWMVKGKDGVSLQLIHKPHKKSGDPKKVKSQLKKLGVQFRDAPRGEGEGTWAR